MICIINARIYTMAKSGEKIIENGYVKISGNLISEVGDMRAFAAGPADEANIIEAGGKWLLPGFIDAHTHLGMYEDGLRSEGDDLNEATDPCTPQLRALDAVNPMDRTLSEALAAGVTCAATGPGSANPISGQFAVIKTCGKRIDDMAVKKYAGMKLALGENPKGCYGARQQTPQTRMATASIIRENLKKAAEYGKKEKKKEKDFDMKSEALLPLIKGEVPAHIHAHRADDIFTAIRLCREFGVDFVIVHCTEGHLIALDLAAENVKAIVGPIISDRSKPELKNLELKNAKVLDEAGVLFSITTDHPVTPLQYLPYCAALSVKGGLDFYSALKSITINPAVILGIDDIVGSIEEGKHADMVLYGGSPFEIMSKAEIVIVNGKIAAEDYNITGE